jgi:transcriptional regulator with XRE-family HTH domain
MQPSSHGKTFYARRHALGWSLLDVNRRTGLSLLALMELERGGTRQVTTDLRRVEAALDLGRIQRALSALPSTDGIPAPAPCPTAEAVERFLRHRR